MVVYLCLSSSSLSLCSYSKPFVYTQNQQMPPEKKETIDPQSTSEFTSVFSGISVLLTFCFGSPLITFKNKTKHFYNLPGFFSCHEYFILSWSSIPNNHIIFILSASSSIQLHSVSFLCYRFIFVTASYTFFKNFNVFKRELAFYSPISIMTPSDSWSPSCWGLGILAILNKVIQVLTEKITLNKHLTEGTSHGNVWRKKRRNSKFKATNKRMCLMFLYNGKEVDMTAAEWARGK